MSAPLMTAETLRAAGRTPSAPCRVALGDGRLLEVTRWLRVLPGKRLTGQATLDGQPVLAKLFIAASGSVRHQQREQQGLEALVANRIPTPHLLGTGLLRDGGHYLLTGFLAEARELTTADRVAPLFALLGRMHAAGLAHEDAHLGNFLQWRDELLVVDGDAIRGGISPLAARDNLALLLAQLPPENAPAPLLAAYRQAHPALAIDTVQLAMATEHARRRRLDDNLDKCLRDCSLFAVARSARRFVALVREEAAFLGPIVADPDRWLEAGTPLKRGRTATLALVEAAGRRLVIKRYNIKSAGHALSRCWRPSRAWHSWLAGHRLRFLGVATPRPLALVEQRLGPLRGKAWLITEHCPGTSLADLLAHRLDTPPADVVAALGRLFAQLAAAHISHGDLKATNLLWHDGEISLVDLDAMRAHRGTAGFARAWRRDRTRLLRNWPEGCALRGALDAALPPA